MELLPEFDVGSDYIDLYGVKLFSKLNPNAKCTVTIDGTTYETTARHDTYNAYEWYVIGNSELLGEGGEFDTHLPFGIFIDKYDENWGQCLEDISTIKIDAIGEVVVKIPEIYLPTKIGIEGSGSYSEIFNDLAGNTASGDYSRAENFKTTASGYASNAQGIQSKAGGYASHAQGCGAEANGSYSHAEGYWTVAEGAHSHAEGEMTVVSSYASHAEGSYTTMPDGTTRYGTAAGYASHTEGGGCHTNGVASHAEGIATTANGRCAHVEGTYTIASGKAQHVEGIANIEDTEDKYIHIAGNGTLPTDRSNAYTLDWDGNGWFAGNVEATAIILRSSTEGSTKTFKLTINDNGELSIVENT